MALAEMWDYLSATPVTADYTATDLDIAPSNVQTETSRKNQVAHYGDDGSEEVVSYSDDSIFYVNLSWEQMSEADAGTIFDFFNAPGKGNGIAQSFYWNNYGESSDRHIYTVKFASELPRNIRTAMQYGIGSIKLKVLGRKP